jgi:hypothetical protein
MGKRIWLLFVIIVLTLSSGCDLNFSATSQETPSGPSLDEISTLSALSTQAYTTPTLGLPELSTLTPTPDLSGQGGEQPTETNTPGNIKPTKTAIPGSIKITSITQKSPGIAIVKWEATGDFPSGFKIVFGEQQTPPTYPENTYASVYSSTARAGVISYSPDRIYYVRVCRFQVNTCDIYSDLGIFAFAPPTKTPRPTRTPSKLIVNGTEVVYDSSLVITQIKGGENGKAYFEWKDGSSTAKGYKIVYSVTSAVPAYPSDPFFSISDAKARSAFVDGNSGTKYYYRICRFNGTACTSYSAPYTFTFPGTILVDTTDISIIGVADVSTGIVQITWSATGSFPNGFKLLYSKANTLPTLADGVITISDGTARSVNFSGDASSTYYVRVCKYTGSECANYSQVVYFTFGADYSWLVINGVADSNISPGYITLDWNAYPYDSFPLGYKLLYSSNSTPTIDNSSTISISSGYAWTGTIPSAPGTLYYLRVCKTVGTTCGAYSDIVSFTTATTGMTLTKDSGTPDKYNWTLPGDASNADGYRLLWVEGTNITPDWTGFTGYQAAAASSRTLTLSSALPNGDYILRLCTWNATDNKCMAYSNTLKVSVP